MTFYDSFSRIGDIVESVCQDLNEDLVAKRKREFLDLSEAFTEAIRSNDFLSARDILEEMLDIFVEWSSLLLSEEAGECGSE